MTESSSGKKIAYVIAPNDFRDEEYFQPKVILQSHGLIVDTVAKGDPDEATGSKGGKAKISAHLDSITPDAYDALIFAGGSGAKVYLRDSFIRGLVQAFYEQGKVIGAICIAPSILANAGILAGKQATAYSDQEENLKAKGVLWSSQPVVVDGRIVTASGPEAAIEFGEKIAQTLANS